MYVEPLGRDRCLDDRCAVCTYYHLKLAALNGHRSELTREQLEFVGVIAWHRDTSGGWHQPADNMYEVNSPLSAEDTAVLQALMNAGHADTVEFMG